MSSRENLVLTSLFLIFIQYISFSEGGQFQSKYTYVDTLDGWLKMHRLPATWNSARLRCHAEGAVLASPLNEIFLKEMLKTMKTNSTLNFGVFTGIHASIYKGLYFSVEGVPLENITVEWAPEEPDDHDNSENCLMLYANGTMADVNCNFTFPYMCYKKGSKKYKKINECGTTDNNYKLVRRTNNCYKFHSVCATWRTAYMICAAEGGHLAIINSNYERDILRSLFDSYSSNSIQCYYASTAMLGYWDWNNDSTWFTIHGQTLEEAGYASWESESPDNKKLNNVGQHCGGMMRNGLLDDVWCDVPMPFICEKEINL
ncbi:macrophage mannose receptor 1-like [Achroia grisella]|uniref:macrophage mannose receptor 1-like n=1 Tax=Achroia grisella TaxID=688607 RepID=UPI0027D331DA|nr:macrophage mannose receptor 1-like [Achroia grisella]